METTKSHKATIPLSGDELTRFNAIRDHMTKTMPGISPTSADVLRHTLYLAEKQVSVQVSVTEDIVVRHEPQTPPIFLHNPTQQPVKPTPPPNEQVRKGDGVREKK